jgi:hypothetical protein
VSCHDIVDVARIAASPFRYRGVGWRNFSGDDRREIVPLDLRLEISAFSPTSFRLKHSDGRIGAPETVAIHPFLSLDVSFCLVLSEVRQVGFEPTTFGFEGSLSAPSESQLKLIAITHYSRSGHTLKIYHYRVESCRNSQYNQGLNRYESGSS